MSDSILPVLLVAFCLGALTGLRTFTPIAVLAWTLHLRYMHIPGSSLHFLHTTAAVVVLTLLAVGELIADKMPNTPSRLKPPGMIGRVIFGFICGMVSGQAWGANWETCAAIGLVGAILGALLGYEVRKGWVHTFHWHDFPVALIEDAVAIGGSILVISRAVFLSY
ncbi:MAG: DUF4126 family protein [Terriglobia bacterium]|nr:DUF4126 family protein [Terriglobia bacterium]